MDNIKNNFIEGKGDSLYHSVLIKGKNISVRDVVRELSQGKSYADLMSANPELQIEDIHLCLEYAFRLIGAISFKKAVSAISAVDTKIDAAVNALDKFRAKLNDPSFAEKYFLDSTSNAEDKIQYWTDYAFKTMRKEKTTMPPVILKILSSEEFKNSGVTEENLRESIAKRFSDERGEIISNIKKKLSQNGGELF